MNYQTQYIWKWITMTLWQWIILDNTFNYPYIIFNNTVIVKKLQNGSSRNNTVCTVLCRQDHTWGDFTDKGQTLGTVGGLPFASGAVDTDTGPGAHAGLPRSPGCVDHRPHGVHPCVGARALEKRTKAQLSIYALFKQLSYTCNKCCLLWFMPVWRQWSLQKKFTEHSH